MGTAPVTVTSMAVGEDFHRWAPEYTASAKLHGRALKSSFYEAGNHIFESFRVLDLAPVAALADDNKTCTGYVFRKVVARLDRNNVLVPADDEDVLVDLSLPLGRQYRRDPDTRCPRCGRARSL